MSRPYKKCSIVERLHKRIDVRGQNDCWECQGYKDKDGYGAITLRSDGKHMTKKMHRVAYEIFEGDIPEGMHVLHKCDNPACCNPKHLFLGTQQDNMKDKFDKKRHHFGSKHPMAKLTDKDVKLILEMASAGVTHQIIANKFNVARQSISRIATQGGWKTEEVLYG